MLKKTEQRLEKIIFNSRWGGISIAIFASQIGALFAFNSIYT